MSVIIAHKCTYMYYYTSWYIQCVLWNKKPFKIFMRLNGSLGHLSHHAPPSGNMRVSHRKRSKHVWQYEVLPPFWTMAAVTRKKAMRYLSQFGAFILTRFGFWNSFSMLMLFAERADVKRYVFDRHKPNNVLSLL